MSLLTRTIWLDVWKTDILSLKQKVRSQRHFVPKDMQKISPVFCVSVGLTVWQSHQNFWRVEERFYFFQKEKTEHVFVKGDWEALLSRAEFLRNQLPHVLARLPGQGLRCIHKSFVEWIKTFIFLRGYIWDTKSDAFDILLHSKVTEVNWRLHECLQQSISNIYFVL